MSKDAAREALFANKEPGVRAVYDKVLTGLAKVGPVKVEPKKTSNSLDAADLFRGRASEEGFPRP